MDMPYFILVLLLMAVGLIALFSASYATAYYKMKGNSTHFVFRQGLFAVLGIGALLTASRIPYRKLHYLAAPSMAISVILLILVRIPGIGTYYNGAYRWIDLGFTNFQPSELAKGALILCFASMITLYGPKKMRQFKYGIAPFVGLIGLVSILLLIEPHLSATVIVAMTGIIMIFIGGANMGWLIGAGAVGITGAVAFVVTNQYAMDRVKVWLDPFIDFQGDGWQGAQSFMAIGSGGFWGLGLGQSRQKHLYLPETANDFIFSVWCEEMGFVGAMLVIIAFAALIIRGYQIALRAPDRFGTLLVAGITTQIALQTLFNMGVVSGLLPVTGASLPFFSYGGTSLLILLIEAGAVLSVSREIPAPDQG